MTDQEKKDTALKKAGEILIEAFGPMYGSIKYNLQGRRKTIHANIVNQVEVEIAESFDSVHSKDG